jgi:Branched-chain amino acid ATP-binding cassette transporter
VAEVQADERVREVYLGRSRDERSGATATPIPPALDATADDGDDAAIEVPT